MYDVSRKEKTDTYIHQQALRKKSIPDGVGRVMPWLFCRLLGFRVRLFRMRTHLLVLIPLFEQGRITMTVSDTPLE